MATYEEVTALMATMSLAFPKYEIQKGALRIYSEMLKDLPIDVLDAAAKEMIIASPFYPSVSEWRNKAVNLMIGSHNIPTAAEAWEEAIDHCRHGKYTDYSHPLIERAAMAIGVQFWSSMLTEQEMATRAHFMKIYDSMLGREMETVKMLPESKQVSAKYAELADKLSMNKQLGDGSEEK